jgi:hypothetical protein
MKKKAKKPPEKDWAEKLLDKCWFPESRSEDEQNHVVPELLAAFRRIKGESDAKAKLLERKARAAGAREMISYADESNQEWIVKLADKIERGEA